MLYIFLSISSAILNYFFWPLYHIHMFYERFCPSYSPYFASTFIVYYSSHPWHLYPLKPPLIRSYFQIQFVWILLLQLMTYTKNIIGHAVETRSVGCFVKAYKPFVASQKRNRVLPQKSWRSHIPVQTFKLHHLHFHHDFHRTLRPLHTSLSRRTLAHLPTLQPLPLFNKRTQEHYQWRSECMQTAWQCSLNACAPPATSISLLCHPRCDPSAVEPLVLPHMQTSSLSHTAGISSEGRWTPGADAAQFWWPHARWRRGSDRGVACQRLQIVTKYNKWNDCSLYSSIFMSPSYQGSNDTAAPCYYIVKMSGIRVK